MNFDEAFKVEFLQFDRRVEAEVLFLPRGCDPDDLRPLPQSDRHLLWTSFGRHPKGRIHVNVFLAGTPTDAWQGYNINQELNGLATLAVDRIPKDGLGKLVSCIAEPLHRWIAYVAGATNCKLIDRSWDDRMHLEWNGDQFPPHPCFAEVSPVGSRSVKAFNQAQPAQRLRLRVDTESYVLFVDDVPHSFKGSPDTQKMIAQYIADLIEAAGDPVPRPDKLKSRHLTYPEILLDLIEAIPGGGTRIPRQKLFTAETA